MRKYRFVTAYEPAFPDIKKVLLSHQNNIYEDEELREVFPNGARDFQVSERREAKNIKELLATSTISTVVNEKENSGSGPCNKNCAYCDHLRKTEADTLKSMKTGSVYKIRQNITCESKDIIYIISCRRIEYTGSGMYNRFKRKIKQL